MIESLRLYKIRCLNNAINSLNHAITNIAEITHDDNLALRYVNERITEARNSLNNFNLFDKMGETK